MLKRLKLGQLGTRTVEWCAAAAVVVLALQLVLPAARTSYRHAAIKRTAVRGQQLHALITGINRTAELAPALEPYWPTNRFVNSTRYFRTFFTSGLCTNAFPAELLAAPGVPALTSTNPADFSFSNNAWCITMPAPNQTNDYPLLFTRNFSAGDKKHPILTDVTEFNRREAPFGDNAGIVVSARGVVRVIRATDLTAEVTLQSLFNPTGATNEFQSPYAAGERVIAP